MDHPLLPRLREQTAPFVREFGVAHGLVVLQLDPDQLGPLAARLRELGFDLLLDVTAVDWPEQQPRFEVVYHLLSTAARLRVRLKTRVAEAVPTVPSLTHLYGSAHFLERECHEMYGIEFTGNPDLRPILLYEGFVGHPLRKDYPKQREQPLIPYREGWER